jgi:hypothetical protein
LDAEHRISAAFGWAFRRKGQLLVGSGGLALAVTGVWASVSPDFVKFLISTNGRISLAFAAVWVGVGLLFQLSETSNLEHLRKDADQSKRILDAKQLEVDQRDDDISQLRADIKELFNGQLAVLASRLEFKKKHRITVFAHVGDRLVKRARFSGNPEFMDSKGRGEYPTDQGCIGMAVADGEFYMSFCDPRNETMYCKQMEEIGIPSPVARNFRMKSRSYGAFAIDDEEGRTVAVIAFECLDVNGLNMDSLRGNLESDKLRIRNFLLRTEKRGSG